MTRPDPCNEFRARLERALEGRPMPRELTILSWHEHLLGCAGCRELLEREEALEALLVSMPEPRLEPDLTRRVLARLRSERGDGLDALLELDRAERAPAGLAGRVLAGLRERAELESERRLDALLELDRELPAPTGLAARVLRGLEPARLAPIRRLPSPRFLLAAAAVLAFAALPLLWPEPPVAPVDPERVASAELPRPDAELRAFLEQGGLDILDEPLLWSAEEDLEIALATSLDPRYETVLDYDEQGASDGRTVIDEESRDG